MHRTIRLPLKLTLFLAAALATSAEAGSLYHAGDLQARPIIHNYSHHYRYNSPGHNAPGSGHDAGHRAHKRYPFSNRRDDHHAAHRHQRYFRHHGNYRYGHGYGRSYGRDLRRGSAYDRGYGRGYAHGYGDAYRNYRPGFGYRRPGLSLYYRN